MGDIGALLVGVLAVVGVVFLTGLITSTVQAVAPYIAGAIVVLVLIVVFMGGDDGDDTRSVTQRRKWD